MASDCVRRTSRSSFAGQGTPQSFRRRANSGVLRLGFATAALRTAGVLARSSDERGGVSELADTAALPWRLRTGTSALRTIPKGLRPPAQGCEARATLGTRPNEIPEGDATDIAGRGATLVGVVALCLPLTHGIRFASSHRREAIITRAKSAPGKAGRKRSPGPDPSPTIARWG